MPTINIPTDLIPSEAFLDRIPKVPHGKYAHIVMLRETESFPLFQTDGSLNTARVRAGLQQAQNIRRIIMFKRKQVAPERLIGRELLRRYGVTQADNARTAQPPYCEYNEQHCQQCPDCVYYGFAIGESGSEKSKVYTDSAFSITGYDESHRQFSFNALFEKGNMSQEGQMQTAFGEQDHVLPQIFFPSVVTIKDVTPHSFVYVLNNLLRAKRYGATGTRTGKMENHLVGVIFADGEIFSNLKLTQKVYDLLSENKQEETNPAKEADATSDQPGENDERKPIENIPLNVDHVLAAMSNALQPLLAEDGVQVACCLTGEQLSKLTKHITEITTDSVKLNNFLQEAAAQAKDYYTRVIARPAGTSRGSRSGSAGKETKAADVSAPEVGSEANGEQP